MKTLAHMIPGWATAAATLILAWGLPEWQKVSAAFLIGFATSFVLAWSDR